MPTKTVDKDRFVYITYRYVVYADLMKLREIIGVLLRSVTDRRDIVVDLSSCEEVTDREVALLATVAKAFRGLSRRLRVIATAAHAKKMRNPAFFSEGSLDIYTAHADFFKDIDGSRASTPVPVFGRSTAPELA